MVHVGLDELEGFFFNHTSCLRLEHTSKLLDQVTADTLALLTGLVECMSDDLLNIIQSLNALSHTQAEISEPLVIQSNSPVFREELNCVVNDVSIVSLGELV